MPYTGIVHIGLSYGIISFAQDPGSLGILLKEMFNRGSFLQKKYGQKSNPFEDVFGDNYEELLRVTNASDESGLAIWKRKYGKKTLEQLEKEGVEVEEIRNKRVQKVALSKKGTDKQDLWENGWVERFRKAGEVEEFRQVQRKVAFDEYFKPALKIAKQFNLRTARGIAVAFDRCVQQGPGAWWLFMNAGKKLGVTPGAAWSVSEKQLLEKVHDLSPVKGGGQRRVKGLLYGHAGISLTVNSFDIDSYEKFI